MGADAIACAPCMVIRSEGLETHCPKVAGWIFELANKWHGNNSQYAFYSGKQK